ncbi:uncharacterized protein [Chanodichthys erythropterus]|uniref:uncharacterized protein n=1 Tax=Chanodichthys erythropterus TaxID=933992 RepID=UPI00351E5501
MHFSSSGRGVFTTRAFFRGDFALEYRGELLSSEESLDRAEHYTEAENAFLFEFQWRGRNWCIDASKEDGSLGRLVNDEHRNPTCKMRTLEVSRKPHLCLFAVRDILPGEEITFNHGYSDWPWRVKPLNQASTESSDKKPSISLGPQRSPHCAAPVSSPGLDEVNSSGPHKQSGKARTSRKTKRFQSRLAKLRKHHEDCYERFNRAEIENECNTIAKQLSQKDCLSSLVTSTTDASSSSPPCAVSTSVMTSSPSPYYRLPEGTMQLAKISKVLMAMEKGTLSDFKGKKLDNIEIDPNEQLERLKVIPCQVMRRITVTYLRQQHQQRLIHLFNLINLFHKRIKPPLGPITSILPSSSSNPLQLSLIPKSLSPMWDALPYLSLTSQTSSTLPSSQSLSQVS